MPRYGAANSGPHANDDDYRFVHETDDETFDEPACRLNRMNPFGIPRFRCQWLSYKERGYLLWLSRSGVVYGLGRQCTWPVPKQEERIMSIGTILLIILVIALLGGFTGIGGGRFYGTGYYGGGGLGLLILILLVLVLMGRI